VVVGNGMAGMRTVEELLKLAPDLYDITVFGAEPHGNYNRILLSPVLAGEKTVDDIMLTRATGMRSTASPCTRATRWCASTAGAHRAGPLRHHGGYDRLLLATGSTPFIIPCRATSCPA
jgi:nitrite reductase (NADH) large subunit